MRREYRRINFSSMLRGVPIFNLSITFRQTSPVFCSVFISGVPFLPFFQFRCYCYYLFSIFILVPLNSLAFRYRRRVPSADARGIGKGLIFLFPRSVRMPAVRSFGKRTVGVETHWKRKKRRKEMSKNK